MTSKFGPPFRRNPGISRSRSRFLALGSTESVCESNTQRQSEEEREEQIPLDSVGENAAPSESPPQDATREEAKEPAVASAWKRAVLMIGLALAVLCMALVSLPHRSQDVLR